MSLAFPVELMNDLRSIDGEKPRVRLMSHRARDQGLAASRWSVEQDPLGRVDAEPLEDFRIPQRQLDNLADPVQLAFQSANVLIRQRARGFGRCGGPRPRSSRAANLKLRGRIDHDCAGRDRRHNLEIGRSIAEKLGPHAVARHDRQAIEKAADVLEVAIARRNPQRIEHHPLRWSKIGLLELNRLVDAAPAFSRVTPSICT